MKNRYFLSPRGTMDHNTVVLVRNILSRRSQRLGASKPQTANPDLGNPRAGMYSGTGMGGRPGTSPFSGNYRAVEEHFPPPPPEPVEEDLEEKYRGRSSDELRVAEEEADRKFLELQKEQEP